MTGPFSFTYFFLFTPFAFFHFIFILGGGAVFISLWEIVFVF